MQSIAVAAGAPARRLPLSTGVFAVSYDSLTKERIRLALSHGGGIDSILFALLAGAGIVVVVVLLVFGFSTAENNAERDAKQAKTVENGNSAEMGTN